MYKLSKALYGLKQALWAWYARLKTFLLEYGNVMGCVHKTLFTLNHGTNFLLVHIYVDDIIFGGSSHSCVQISRNDGEWVPDVHDGKTNLLLRYPSEANEARYLRASSQVHEGPNEEVQHGGAQACVYLMSTAMSLGPDEDGKAVD
jgi:hypothetical protein